MNMKPITFLLLTAISAFLLAGCGDGLGYPACRWEGTVLIKGEALPPDAVGTITVTSSDANSSSKVVSAPITGGKYVLENVPKGNVSVHFDLIQETPAKNPEDAARGITDVKELLPKKFKNDFPDTADQDNLSKDFDLK